MAEEDDTAVALGEGRPVEGAPLARVAARLMWGIEKSAIVDREGDAVIRTPDGPRELADVLAEVDEPYFSTQQEFGDAVRDVIDTGPVPTAEADGEESESAGEGDSEDEESEDTESGGTTDEDTDADAAEDADDE